MSQSLLYITCESMEEAERIGAKLVEERIVACVNLLPGMQSMYWWQGKVEQAQEIVMLAKTTADLVETVTTRIVELHSYEVPCVVDLEIKGGNPEFLKWIHAETR